MMLSAWVAVIVLQNFMRVEVFGSPNGKPIAHFCYPYGDWNEPVRDLVMEAGYLTACTTRRTRSVVRSDTERLPYSRVPAMSEPVSSRRSDITSSSVPHP